MKPDGIVVFVITYVLISARRLSWLGFDRPAGALLVVRLVRRHALPPLPFLLALAMGANTGSVTTLVGNPQNMLCAVLGHLSYRQHLLLAAPLAVICLAMLHVFLGLVFRRQLDGSALASSAAPLRLGARPRVTLAVTAGTAVVYLAGAELAWAAMVGFVVLMLVHRRDTRLLWARIDWSLLVFFCGLFVVVEGLMRSGAPAWLFARFPLAAAATDGCAGWLRTAGVFLAGSNIVSNVPFILAVRDQMATLPHATFGWELLAVASTFAGNLTLLGSVANIIVAESAREIGGIGFLEYLRVGFPFAVATTLVGVAWLCLVFPM